MNKKRIIVAVDGPAGSGKSSVSREAARNTGLKYIDSGAVYRTITWFLLQKYKDPLIQMDFIDDLAGISITQVFNPDGSCSAYIDGRDVSEEIREAKVAENIGVVSDDVEIRDYVNGLLRKWAEKSSIIMDGRDIGSVVFPGADIKIYLDASVDERAKRRAKEYQEKGKNVDIKDIRQQIALRDKQDMTRDYGRLIKADGAIYLDTTNMTREDVVQEITGLIVKSIF